MGMGQLRRLIGQGQLYSGGRERKTARILKTVSRLRRFVGKYPSRQAKLALGLPQRATIFIVGELRTRFEGRAGGIGDTTAEVGERRLGGFGPARSTLNNNATSQFGRAGIANDFNLCFAPIHLALAHTKDIRSRRGLKSDREDGNECNKSGPNPPHHVLYTP